MRIDPRSRAVRAVVWTLALIIALAAFALSVARIGAAPLERIDPCNPRPPIVLRAFYDRDPSRLWHNTVIVEAWPRPTLNDGTKNTTFSVRVTQVRNAEVFIPGAAPQTSRVPYVWTAPSNLDGIIWNPVYLYRKGNQGPLFVAFTVVDRCGPWTTFWGAP